MVKGDESEEALRLRPRPLPQYDAGNIVPDGTGRHSNPCEVAEASVLSGRDEWLADQDIHIIQSPPEASTRPMGLLAGTLCGFKAATNRNHVALTEVQREHFIEGLGAYCVALNSLPGDLGSYLKTHIENMRRSKASATEADYRQWLLSELPVHAAAGYKSYVDDSAWMANLWIGWTLEFWVEFYAEMVQGKETTQSAELAYERSLMKHHDTPEQSGFTAAVSKLPSRAMLLQILECNGDGQTGRVDALADMGEFVEYGRALSEFCLRIDGELEERMVQERNAKKR